MRAPARALLLLAGLGAGSCGSESPSPEPQQRAESVVRDVSVSAAALPGTYTLREFVDMSGHVSPLPVRIHGELRLTREPQRATMDLTTLPLLTGSEVMGEGQHEAHGTWRVDGDELVLQGFDLAIRGKDVFGPPGAARRWRVEREGTSLLVRAGPLTFELTSFR